MLIRAVRLRLAIVIVGVGRKYEIDLSIGIIKIDQEIKLRRLSALIQGRLGLRLELLERLREKELPQGLTLQIKPRPVVQHRVLVAVQH